MRQTPAEMARQLRERGWLTHLGWWFKPSQGSTAPDFNQEVFGIRRAWTLEFTLRLAAITPEQDYQI